jgi:hypothetical protein
MKTFSVIWKNPRPENLWIGRLGMPSFKFPVPVPCAPPSSCIASLVRGICRCVREAGENLIAATLASSCPGESFNGTKSPKEWEPYGLDARSQINPLDEVPTEFLAYRQIFIPLE